MGPALNTDKIRREVTCPICLGLLYTAINLNPCSHKVNELCAKQMFGEDFKLEGHKISGVHICPICRESVTGWSVDHTVWQLAKQAFPKETVHKEVKNPDVSKTSETQATSSESQKKVASQPCDQKQFEVKSPIYGDTSNWKILPVPDNCQDKKPYPLDILLEQGKYSEAVSLAQQGADKNDPDSINFLAFCYTCGIGVTKDYHKAHDLNLKAADLGGGKASYILGMDYGFGIGVSQDWAIAMRYFQQAVDRGYEKAKGNLGYGYMCGLGVPTDIPKALNLLNEAIQAKDGQACYYLGFYYRYITKDKVPQTEIAELFRKGVDLGSPDSIVEYGNCLSQGFGVAQDKSQAIELYTRASHLNHPEGTFILGKCFAEGDGVKKNDAEAKRLFERAAKFGYPKAQVELARRYG